MTKCLRCGRCCLTVGRTFWKTGSLRYPKPFGAVEALNREANNGDHEDGGLPCEKLTFEAGLAVCTIERDYGYKVKPVACRDYPQPGEQCFAETIYEPATEDTEDTELRLKPGETSGPVRF